MTGSKTKIMKRVSNLRAQAFTKTSIGRETTLVIRLKGGKYPSTDKPFGERVMYDIDHQLVSSRTFACFFHGNMVIGLRYKYTAKRVSGKVQKVGEIVHYFPE